MTAELQAEAPAEEEPEEPPCKARRVSPSDPEKSDQPMVENMPASCAEEGPGVQPEAEEKNDQPVAENRPASGADEGPGVEPRAEEKGLAGIPESKVRAEVQSLLVGLDLQTTKYGELRSRLEERLGLSQGTLAARKSRHRRVNFLVQHEVLKRLQRNTDCDTVVKELLELPDYPAAVRQMLIESLPHAMAMGEQSEATVPHPHQVQLLRIAQCALEDGRKTFLAKEAAQAAEVRYAAAKVESQKGIIAAAVAAVDSARATNSREQAALDNLSNEIQDVTREQASLEAKLSEVRTESDKLRSEREGIAAVHDGPAELLASGAWSSQDEWWEAFAPLQQFLLDVRAESSLLDAATISLRKPLKDRSDFDAITVDGVRGLFQQQLEAADVRIEQQQRVDMETEAASLGLVALMGATQQRLERQRDASMQAHSAEEAAVVAVREGEAALLTLQKEAAECGALQAQLAKKLCSLEEALELLEKAIAPPPPVAAEIEADKIDLQPPLPLVSPGESQEETLVVDTQEASEQPVSEALLLAEDLVAKAASVESVLASSPQGKKLSTLSVASPRRVPTPMKGTQGF